MYLKLKEVIWSILGAILITYEDFWDSRELPCGLILKTEHTRARKREEKPLASYEGAMWPHGGRMALPEGHATSICPYWMKNRRLNYRQSFGQLRAKRQCHAIQTLLEIRVERARAVMNDFATDELICMPSPGHCEWSLHKGWRTCLPCWLCDFGRE